MVADPLSYNNYLRLRHEAGMDPNDDMSVEMWVDTPEHLRRADIDMLEAEAKHFRMENPAAAWQQTRPVSDKPESEVTPW